MGTSTDAILMYGVALKDGWSHDSDEEGEDLDMETLAEDDPRRLHDDGDQSEEGIYLEMHCCYEEPMYVLGFLKSQTQASRGSPEVIRNLNCEEYSDEALLAYCKKWDLPIDESVNDGQPGWLLFSMWG